VLGLETCIPEVAVIFTDPEQSAEMDEQRENDRDRRG
jgi:hypothetical protein